PTRRAASSSRPSKYSSSSGPSSSRTQRCPTNNGANNSNVTGTNAPNGSNTKAPDIPGTSGRRSTNCCRTTDTAVNPARTAAAEKGNIGVNRTGTATNARSRPTHANPASANGPDPLSTPVPDTYRFCRWEKAQPDTTTSTGPKTKPDKNPMKCRT